METKKVGMKIVARPVKRNSDHVKVTQTREIRSILIMIESRNEN